MIGVSDDSGAVMSMTSMAPLARPSINEVSVPIGPVSRRSPTPRSRRTARRGRGSTGSGRVGDRCGELERDAVRIEEGQEAQAERDELPDRSVLDPGFVEHPERRIEVASGRHAEAEVIQPDTKGIEAVSARQ